MEIGELVKQFGLPAGLLIYFIIQSFFDNREHKKDLRDIATKTVTALDASTEAIKDATAQSVTNTTALNQATSIMSRVEGIFNARRGGRNNNGGN